MRGLTDRLDRIDSLWQSAGARRRSSIRVTALGGTSIVANSGIAFVFSRRSAAWIVTYLFILAAWAGVVLMGQGGSPEVTGFPGGAAAFWQSICRSAAETDFVALWAMWGLMSAAMMLPTFVPALRAFDDLSACGASDRAGFFALIAGYLVVWIGFSAAGAAAQAVLARNLLVAPDGSSTSLWLTAILLALAGAYRFSAFKDACLAKCRHPLTFFMQHWRPGPAAAAAMGFRLGLFCLGCCWALMALGFVGGTMNLVWMGVATLFMTFEKLPDPGRFLTRPAGVVCVSAGAVFAARAMDLI